MPAQGSADRVLQVLKADTFSADMLEALNSLSQVDKTDRLENALLRVLATTSDPKIRNASAIALADLGSEVAPSVIRDLLMSPSTEGCRGTLLYALKEMGGKLRLDVIVNSLARNSAEAQEELLEFLEEGLVEPASESERAAAVKSVKQILKGVWSGPQRAILEDALELISDLKTA